MWAYIHRDPMGSWQMARHGHTQMPTSYLSHLCQDKTHEAGMESSSRGNKMWEMHEGETYSFTWQGNLKTKKKKCSIIKNSNFLCFCAAWFVISRVDDTFGAEIISTSLAYTSSITSYPFIVLSLEQEGELFWPVCQTISRVAGITVCGKQQKQLGKK